jgi:acid phosphatase
VRRARSVIFLAAGLTVWLAACAAPPADRPAASAPAAAPATPATTSASGTGAASAGASPAGGHSPAHVLVVVLENKASGQVAGAAGAPWINALMAGSAVFTDAHAVAHPSQPNYLALFSGSTHGVSDDHCPVRLGNAGNLGAQLIAAGRGFTGYSEDLPAAGYRGCSHAGYAAKHNPWVDFDTVPASANQPYSAFPTDYATLPTVAFVIPNLCHDMHNCPVSTGDTWARNNLDGYVRWARDNNSLLIVTFDEDDNAPGNHILTLFAGAGVRPGSYGQRVDHYTVLRTIESWYGLAPLGRAAQAAPITAIWS